MVFGLKEAVEEHIIVYLRISKLIICSNISLK